MKIFHYLSILFICILCITFKGLATDTLLINEDDNWKVNDPGRIMKDGIPTIDFNYGSSKLSLDKSLMIGSFADVTTGELRLGWTKKTYNYKNKDIIKYDFSDIFVEKLSTDKRSDNNKTDLRSNVWLFGFASSDGYGWDLGKDAELVLFTSSGINWASVDFKDTSNSPLDKNTLELFKGFRFGDLTEFGVKFQPFKPLGVNISYERNELFSRHLFFYWFVGQIIEGGTNWILDPFIKEVLKRSVIAGPIVNFVLKSAVGYGIYELRKKHENWPFDTAPPLMYDNIKAGINFAF